MYSCETVQFVPGVGIGRQVKKKMANARGCAREGGGMVTVGIEPCITTLHVTEAVLKIYSIIFLIF